ncbi:secreted RxLR effector protein 161-like [Tasmannia lanceolata]|uniref:secreted RxLR effector protein 161-like n=1 Tax=Tasmannia lanceolata TaxID=3420 RepID=UPI0040635810
MDHWKAVKKAMRYLQRTKYYMLTFRKTNSFEVNDYSDSNFAGCRDTMISTSGYIFLLSAGPISWRSVKQGMRTSSTMEVEFIASWEASAQALWPRNFISRLQVVDNIRKSLKIYCDSSAVVFFSKNNKLPDGSKHIRLKYLVVRERIQDQLVSIEYISAAFMLADPMTKGLPPKVGL